MSSTETSWGVWLHADRPASQLAELAGAAEDLGAAAILVADEGVDRDLFVCLAALAQRTRRVLLVGAVTNPHSRHPVASAAAFGTLAELAPGRIVAGFGSGGSRVLGPLGLAPRRPYTALRECIDVVEALWRGETVEHTGEFVVRGAALPWSTGRLPLAVAGRGARVERLAAERADYVLLAGRPWASVPELVKRLRAFGKAARGRAAAIAWNPIAAWTDAMREDLRGHLAYMAVDMPAEGRPAVITDDVLGRYAIVGERAEVGSRLRRLCAEARPELLVFDAGDYSTAFLESVAALAMDAGARVSHNPGALYGLDPHN